MNDSKLSGSVLKREISLTDYVKYYTVQHYCSNCMRKNVAYVRKGRRSKGLLIECDNCGCEEELQ